MKQITFFILIQFSAWLVGAQILHPVTWSYGAKKTGKDIGEIFFKADIGNGWHIYSVNQEPGGPVKTSFYFSKSPEFLLMGKVIEPVPQKSFDNTFAMNILYFERSVVFQQKVKLKGKGTIIKGHLEYMACTNEKCLPPKTINFSVELK